MASLGQATTPNYGVMYYGPNTSNQADDNTGFTMPTGGGLITNLHAYFNLYTGGPVTCWLCVWNGSGTLVASVPVSVSTGGTGIGGQSWQTAALGTPVYVAGGTSLYFGFAVPKANGFYASFVNGGGTDVCATSSPPAAFSGATVTGNGAIGAYCDYLPVSAHILRGGVWQSCSGVDVIRTSAWGSAEEVEIVRSNTWGPTQ